MRVPALPVLPAATPITLPPASRALRPAAAPAAGAPAPVPPLRVHDHRARPAQPAVAWAIVVHPEPVVAALQAQRLAPIAGVAAGFTTGTAALREARRRGEGGLVLVHLEGVDRFRDGWPGHRILARLQALGPGQRVAAWVDPRDVDAIALAGRLGVEVVVRGGATAADRGGVGNFHAWWAGRYPDAAWVDWSEHALAALAGGASLREQGSRFGVALPPEAEQAAVSRLRRVTELLGGEVRDDAVFLRNEAIRVLRRLTWARPLVAEPYVARSLRLTVARLGAEPTLADEAGLSCADVGHLTAIAGCAAHLRGEKAVKGRPAAGAWLRHRQDAILDRAKASGHTGIELARHRDALEALVASALDAVHDVLSDRAEA